MSDDISTALAENLKRLRDVCGLSQQGLAERSGVPRPTVAHLETGTANPTLAVVTKLARALGVGLDELVARDTQRIVIVEPGMLRVEKRGKVRRTDLVPDLVHHNTAFERIAAGAGGRFTVAVNPGVPQLLACERGELKLSASGEEAVLTAEQVAVVSEKVECVSTAGSVVYRLGGLVLEA